MVWAYYLAAINILTYVLFGIDKFKAGNQRRRIPERTLLGCAVLGGALGAWLGMKVFHHKTLHRRFSLGLPLILLLQLLAAAYFLFIK